MKKHLIIFKALSILFIFSLMSCEAEEAYVQSRTFGKKTNQARVLTGNDAAQVSNLLTQKIKQLTKMKIDSESSMNMRTNEGTIDFSSILQVIDTLGINNYTFKIINHPDDDIKTFHNLVLTEKENQFEVTVLKYDMTDQFAQDYYNLVKSMGEFEGTLTARSLNIVADPCFEVVVPSGPGAGGGGDSPGDGGYNPPSDGGGGSSSSGCTEFTTHYECSCGNSFSSWSGAYGCASSGDGNFTITIVINFSTTAFCRSYDDPCNPDGSIGVLPPETDCNTSKEDLKLAFPETPDITLERIAQLINEYGKDFGIDNKYKLQHFLAQAAHESTNLSGIRFGTYSENLNYRIANLGVKAFEKYFNPVSNPTADPNKANPNDFINPSNTTFADKELLSNYVYDDANRSEGYKLGNTNPGDGYKYRGRGIFQLTGREKYTNFNNFYNENYDSTVNIVENPNLVSSEHKIAVISALWYFKNHVIDEIPVGINENTKVKTITKKVNGKYKGLNDRNLIFEFIKNIINCI